MRKAIRRISDAISITPRTASEVVSAAEVVKRTEAAIQAASDPLHPSPALLAKLGFISIRSCAVLKDLPVIETDFDRMALARLLDDHEVRAWLEAMAERSFIPKRG